MGDCPPLSLPRFTPLLQCGGYACRYDILGFYVCCDEAVTGGDQQLVIEINCRSNKPVISIRLHLWSGAALWGATLRMFFYVSKQVVSNYNL